MLFRSQDAEKFPHWLFRIAHNLAFSQLRRPALEQSVEDYPEQDWAGKNWAEKNWEDAQFPLRRSGTGARPVFGLELEFAVAKALDTLTPEQREAVLLKVYHGFRFAEIAEIISCPVSTVKSRIYAGFAQLREMLAFDPARRPVAERRR